jgi:hydroxyacylglutathione hydrolase
MNIYSITSGPVDTNGFLIHDAESNQAVIIDAPMGSAEWFLETADSLNTRIVALLLTHSHWDHTADIPELKRRTQAPLYLHPLDEYRLLDPNNYTGFRLPFTLEATTTDEHLTHGQTLEFGAIRFNVLHTPGHTEGGVCFYSPQNSFVVAGDTLFAGSIGRTDLIGGNYQQLIDSIFRELMTLPDDTIVYSGHTDPTTVGEEKLSNPFLVV